MTDAVHMLRGTPASRLELSFRATALANEDFLGKSDPVLRVFLRDAQGKWQKVGETEVIQNNLNPVWTTAVQVNYFFEETQPLRFEVLDVDGVRGGTHTGDNLGAAECRLSDIVTARGCTLQIPLSGSKSKRSSLVVVAEELAGVKGALQLQLAGQKLANRDGFFGKSDPFFTLAKTSEMSTPVVVAKSNVVKNNLSPTWQPVKVALQRLCNGDLQRPLQLHVLDWDADDKSKEIGSATVNAQVLMQPGSRIALHHTKSRKEAGTVVVAAAQLLMEPTFFEYMQGGVEISCSVAIDFTASNGDPRHPQSLHYYLNPSARNPYETAIAAVAEVLAPYDHDGLFPAYGYGGKLPSGATSHCFALNGNPQASSCAGVAGLLAAYRQALGTVSLSGPTCFAPVIQQACHDAEQGMRTAGGLKYGVLLIVTDGEIMDMDATLEAIVWASVLPLSIIIIGVGSADFAAMKVLDCDGGLLRAPSGRVAVRDCVQFVPFSAYSGLASGARLAADVLAELPDQVVRHFMAVGRPPPPPPAAKPAVAAPAPASLMAPI